MNNSTILDLGLDPRYAQVPQQRSPRHALHIAACALAMLIALAVLAGARTLPGGFRFGMDNARAGQTVRLPLDKISEISAMTVDDTSQILAKGLDAEQQNAQIPLSTLPVEAAHAINLSQLGGSVYGTALRCLTQAVYYEAANEPLEGRRGVAQVVLNRMRHPAFPKSVCGVVYQGVERGWGCQFSFVCDGSLLRMPALGRWHEAEEVARAALAGYVEPSVGTATHYHADYVLPKWAFNLAKIEQIGRHIFYRFPGQWGKAMAFNGNYSGNELIPQLNLAALRLRASENLVPGSDPALALVDTGLTVPPEVTDRHAPADVGGRLDVTKPWRLAIPDPVAASSHYRQALGEPEAAPSSATPGAVAKVASAEDATRVVNK